MSKAIRIPGALLLPVLLLLLILPSCSHRYQVYVLQSKDVQSNGEDFIYRDSTFTISYDFWADGGTVLFNVYNQSEDTIYFHMDSSTWINGNDSVRYYSAENRNELDEPDSLNTLSYSPLLNFTPTVVIAPGVDCWFEGFPVSLSWIKSNDADRDRTIHYAEDQSPIRVKNILTYSSGTTYPKMLIEHDFWVSLVKKTSNNNFQLMVDRNLPKADKFYVSRKLAKGSDYRWLDIGLSVLETLTVLL